MAETAKAGLVHENSAQKVCRYREFAIGFSALDDTVSSAMSICFKNLGRFKTGGSDTRMNLAVPLPKTPDGRVYRYSPNEDAHPRHFVLGDFDSELTIVDELRQRMRHDPRSDKTVCPYSGTVAHDGEFTHPDDVKAAIETVKHAAHADVEEAVGRMIDGLARSTANNKFVKIETKKTHSPRTKPRFVRRDLLRELICDHCGRDYGVYAIGLFCPDCGAPNVRLHFTREVALVSSQVDLAERLDGEHAELAYRILGNAHEDVLTGFEATLKALYQYGVKQLPENSPKTKPVKNDFQNIERASKRFSELNLNPFDQLDSESMDVLNINIQKRHIIGHNLSVVDEKFAEHATDARVGESVQLVAEDIKIFAVICQQVIDRLDAWLVGGVPSPTVAEPSTNLMAGPTKKNDLDPKPQFVEADELDLSLTPLARRVACWIAEHAENGAHDLLNGDQVEAEFSENTERELEEALAELETDGFIDLHRSLGRGLPSLSPLPDLYLTFDPVVFKSDPDADVLTLLKVILESDEESFSSVELHEELGWTRRRFNPVLAYVFSHIDERRISGETGVDYPARSFFLLAEDRVELKRLMK